MSIVGRKNRPNWSIFGLKIDQNAGIEVSKYRGSKYRRYRYQKSSRYHRYFDTNWNLYSESLSTSKMLHHNVYLCLYNKWLFKNQPTWWLEMKQGKVNARMNRVIRDLNQHAFHHSFISAPLPIHTPSGFAPHYKNCDDLLLPPPSSLCSFYFVKK